MVERASDEADDGTIEEKETKTGHSDALDSTITPSSPNTVSQRYRRSAVRNNLQARGCALCGSTQQRNC
jgi:hypothetical protein